MMKLRVDNRHSLSFRRTTIVEDPVFQPQSLKSKVGDWLLALLVYGGVMALLFNLMRVIMWLS